MRASWTDERIAILKNLVAEGRNTKKIAEIMNLRTEQVRQARTRFIPKDDIRILVDEIDPGKCFADSNGITCNVLKKKRCKGCNFFKTHEQVKQGREKALKRIMSLDLRIRNNIEMLYGLESLQ